MKQNRKQMRLKNYDYSENGAYFVTICTYEKRCIFGYVKDGKMHCNDYGKIRVETQGYFYQCNR